MKRDNAVNHLLNPVDAIKKRLPMFGDNVADIIHNQTSSFVSGMCMKCNIACSHRSSKGICQMLHIFCNINYAT